MHHVFKSGGELYHVDGFAKHKYNIYQDVCQGLDLLLSRTKSALTNYFEEDSAVSLYSDNQEYKLETYDTVNKLMLGKITKRQLKKWCNKKLDMKIVHENSTQSMTNWNDLISDIQQFAKKLYRSSTSLLFQ